MSRNHKTSGTRDASHALALKNAMKTSSQKPTDPFPSTDSSGWLTDTGMLRQRAPEAEAIAKRLGHRLTQWVWREEARALQARCENCAEIALLRPRSWLGSPLGGPALTFGCK
jgi:hypothetical protein